MMQSRGRDATVRRSAERGGARVARRQSSARRAPSPEIYIDTRPGHNHEDLDDVPPDEASRRFERSYRFGTGGGGGSGYSFATGEAPPARPAAPFDWTRYDHTWRDVAPRTLGQTHYQNTLSDQVVRVVVGLGAAGTGKTLLAVQEGLKQLRSGTVRKLIFTRPAVLAGEALGHLPGSESDKIEPLLAPLLDSITKIMGPGAWAALQNANLLELQSFAYMRGRTQWVHGRQNNPHALLTLSSLSLLSFTAYAAAFDPHIGSDEAFVIADEEQNASFTQLKLLATRVGCVQRVSEGAPVFSLLPATAAGHCCQPLLTDLTPTPSSTNSKLCILGDPAQPDRAVGGNWSAAHGSSLDMLAQFVENGGVRRAPGVNEDNARSIAVARLTGADCQRSETAATMLSAFGQMEQERPSRGEVSAGANGFLAFQQAVRSVVQQGGRGDEWE